VTTNAHARRDQALAWLAAQQRWEQTLERLRFLDPSPGRPRRTSDRRAA
jgi:hypothetical protein